MSTMGRHSPPLDGTVTANGHQLAAFTVPPLDRLPAVSVLPQQDDPARSGTTADNPGRWRRLSAHRAWPAAVPVVLVNAVAFGAQLGFWNAHLDNLPQAVLVALALESIAVYLAWQAHLAQLADDSALRLRLAAYGIAVLIGTLNYSHFMRPGWRPTVAAVTFGMMSAISPWLWSVHSRRVSRDALKARGLIEPHAVRLGATRWAWHPARSARVMWRATWEGETDPARAIALAARADMTDDDEVRPGQPGKNGGEGTGLVGSLCENFAAVAAPVVTPRHDSDHDKKDDKPQRKAAPRKPAAAMTNKELAEREGVSVRTLQRRRNGGRP